MRLSILCTIVAGLTLANPARSQTQPLVVAILPFEDRGSYGQDPEVFRARESELAAALASELSQYPDLRIIQRSGETLGRLDAATAAKIGAQSGARYVITGRFTDVYGKFRVDARVIEVATGNILRVVSNQDARLQDRSGLSGVIRGLAEQVAGVLGAAATGRGRRP